MSKSLRIGAVAVALVALPAALRAEEAAPQGAASQSAPAARTPPKTASLDDLLRQVRTGMRSEAAEHAQREKAFVAAKSEQKALLGRALADKAALEQRSVELERTFERNEARITELEETLRIRLGTMGELFGVIRQVAGDTRSQLEGSLVSAQLPGRADALAELAGSKKLPSVAQLENLWFLLQEEMVESGKVSRFSAPVVTAGGAEQMRDVVRVGTFNAVASGKYLRWMPSVGKLAELGRQPAARYLATVADLEQSTQGSVRFAVDPSRGSILSLLVQTPSLWERIQFGGLVGYVIIALGLATLLLGLARLAMLGRTHFQVAAQQQRTVATPDNPLGRVLNVYAANEQVDTESLERRLDEAIIHETGRLERFLWAIKVVSVVAPLMGLLGTVTGMIRTFQAITLFGTGDPKLMASGISEALVTTMLGLVVAIPLVLLHSALNSLCRRISGVLEEQSAGMIATRSEEEKIRDAAA